MVLVRKQLKLNLLAVAAAALTLPAWAVGPPTWAFPAGRTLPVADSTTNHVISVGVPCRGPPSRPGWRGANLSPPSLRPT